MNSFKEVLKGLRIEHDLTQKEIANIIDVSERTYSRYETGDREPRIDTLIKIAEYYKIPIDLLVGRYTEIRRS